MDLFFWSNGFDQKNGHTVFFVFFSTSYRKIRLSYGQIRSMIKKIQPYGQIRAFDKKKWPFGVPGGLVSKGKRINDIAKHQQSMDAP